MMLANSWWGMLGMTELADVFAELDDPRAVNARRHRCTKSWSSRYAP